ncbi:MAG: adenosylhomocysteinase [Pseudonocardiaceae bacterium]
MSAYRGERKVSLALRDMPGLRTITARHEEFGELAALNILGCVTVTPETGAFVRTLAELGANIRWCSDNQFASDDDVVDYLAADGIPVFARSNMSTAEYFEAMDRARDFSGRTGEDIQVIDDGVDITSHLATRNDPAYFDSVCFITEQTTCGVAGLEHLYERGLLPVPAINRTVYSLCQGALTNLIAGRATHRLS